MSRSAIARRRQSSGTKHATIISASTITIVIAPASQGSSRSSRTSDAWYSPVTNLVEVVAGNHGRVGRAQLLGELRLALEADAERVLGELGEGEHLAGDLEHRCLRAEGEGLGHPRKDRHSFRSSAASTHRPGGTSSGSPKLESSSGPRKVVISAIPSPSSVSTEMLRGRKLCHSSSQR